MRQGLIRLSTFRGTTCVIAIGHVRSMLELQPAIEGRTEITFSDGGALRVMEKVEDILAMIENPWRLRLPEATEAEGAEKDATTERDALRSGHARQE